MRAFGKSPLGSPLFQRGEALLRKSEEKIRGEGWWRSPFSKGGVGGGFLFLLLLFVFLSSATLAQDPVDPTEPAQPEEPVEVRPDVEPGEVTPEGLVGEEDTAEEPAAPATPAEPAEEPPPAGAIEFTVPFPEDQGGGVATGWTGDFRYEQDVEAELSDGVQIRYQDVVLSADRARIDIPTKTVTAEGDVVIDQGPRRLAGETLTFDLEGKTGTVTQASGYVSPGYFMTGEEISKVGEDVYTLEDGSFTSCEQDVPAWSFRLGKARVRVGGYAKVKNASMRVKKVPVFFTPYLLWPVKEDRTSGFLVPQPGWSDRRGPSLSLAYYQVLGRSYDTTFELDLFGEDFIGLGNELRYHPSENTRGTFVGYVIRDPQAELEGEDEYRWKVHWDHETRDLPFGLRGVVQFQDFSDFDFFRDFERDFNQTSLRFLDSRGYVSGNWGPHSLNILVNERETFLSEDRIISLSKLPEIEYRLRPTKLGPTPLYLVLDSSLDYLSLDRSETFQGDYLRGDFFPQLTLPLRAAPWLSLSFTAGQRLTFYDDSLRTSEELEGLPPEERDRFRGESLTRDVPFASAEIIGPSFSRIFEGEANRYKHVIEPRLTWLFRDDFDDEDRIPLFDEVDNLRSTNLGRVSFINRILAKPAGEDGGSAREILLLELSQAFSFDEEQPLQRGRITELIDGQQISRNVSRTAGPIIGLLRFNPTDRLSLKTQVDYNTLFSQIESTQLSGDVRFGANLVGLTWFTRTRADVSETVNNQIRLSTTLALIPNKLRWQSEINYDFEQSLLQQQRHIIDFTGSCYGLRFEVRDFQAGLIEDTDFRFAVTLKNVGTFLDITGGFSNRSEL